MTINYKKVVPFFENNVQWIALALGFAFFVYIGWTYIINDPARMEATPGDRYSEVDPGSVDEYVQQNYATKLSNGLTATVPLPPPNFPPVTPIADEPSRWAFAGPRPLFPMEERVLANGGMSWNATPVGISSVLPASPQIGLVADLPVTPPLKYLDEEFLRTVVLVPDASGQGVKKDKDTVTTFWELPIDQLSAAYAATLGKKIPLGDQLTMPLHAELIREQEIDGQWGHPQVIHPIAPAIGAPPPPVAWPPPPAAQVAYRGWAQQNASNILAPGFFTVAYQGNPQLNWVPFDQLHAPPPPTGAPGNGQQPAPAQPAAAPPVPNLAPLPNGMFAPNKNGVQQNMLTWLIDDTVIPGCTYRYSVRYSLYNPLFQVPQRVARPAMAAQFNLDSAQSGWSVPISIPLKTRFWIVSGMRQPVQPTARAQLQTVFDVYTWHDGLWHYQPFNSIPGDEIGGNLGDQGDYTSHWTYLDLVFGPNGGGGATQGLVVSDFDGQVVARDIAGDETSAAYKKFQADFAAQPATPGTPVQLSNPSNPNPNPGG